MISFVVVPYSFYEQLEITPYIFNSTKTVVKKTLLTHVYHEIKIMMYVRVNIFVPYNGRENLS
jgi:hypothetical protein